MAIGKPSMKPSGEEAACEERTERAEGHEWVDGVVESRSSEAERSGLRWRRRWRHFSEVGLGCVHEASCFRVQMPCGRVYWTPIANGLSQALD